MTESPAQIKALVVCLGNICRSPMGEAVLKDIAKKRGLDIVVDSCGTAAYHAGESPDERYAFFTFTGPSEILYYKYH
jgi:low molecular weight phosphotyrosine protein phosphatase